MTPEHQALVERLLSQSALDDHLRSHPYGRRNERDAATAIEALAAEVEALREVVRKCHDPDVEPWNGGWAFVTHPGGSIVSRHRITETQADAVRRALEATE